MLDSEESTGELGVLEKYICIHGHFYQPPRENPWLEVVELQDSAHPYHDWNERITAECYATNSASRILDDQNRITQVVNNYSKISFNFGPTLLAWIEKHAPNVYEGILEADRQSRTLFSGHGSAMAQAYNHMILPLANRRDKVTQIVWGIRDFEHRFGRHPEGMWLPETAVDLETLDILADHGIRFTILAPRQAKQARRIGEERWFDVSVERIDPTMPYVQLLPSGRKIALFFYDGPVSKAVAFEGLLNRGESLAQRLLGAFDDCRERPQLVHIATDGESYGHHHRHGDMALAYALHFIESRGLAKLTNYGEYLDKYPPTHEVEIFENSSWSCVHGIERWRSDCGCNSGGRGEWNQGWRAPLREALNFLCDTLAPAFAGKSRGLLKDPWRARDEYIRIVLDRSIETMEAFVHAQATRPLTQDEKVTVIKLLEMQRHLMLMYTSCGWFFDELSGIETIQVLQYGGRALQLGKDIFGNDVEPRFLELLGLAESNIREHKDGQRIFENFVKPAAVDLIKVGAHYAMSSLFEDYAKQEDISCFTADQEVYERAEAGKVKIAVGRVKVTSEITGEEKRLCFGVLHWGDHNLSGCVRECSDNEPDEVTVREILHMFGHGAFLETLHLLEKQFGASMYSLRSMFRDEQRKILDIILESTLSNAVSVYRQVYENNAPLMRFLKDLNIPAPGAIKTAAEYVLNASMRKAFEEETLRLETIEMILTSAELEGVSLDTAGLEMAARRKTERMAEALAAQSKSLTLLRELDSLVGLLVKLPFEVSLRKVQDIYYALLQNIYPEFQNRVKKQKKARSWVEVFRSLGEKLMVRVE
jgi:alpha-amylase/alpha-mannosidase (GH57 family)